MLYYTEPNSKTFFAVSDDENQYVCVTFPFENDGISYTDITLSNNQPLGHRERIYFANSKTLKASTCLEFLKTFEIANVSIKTFLK